MLPGVLLASLAAAAPLPAPPAAGPQLLVWQQKPTCEIIPHPATGSVRLTRPRVLCCAQPLPLRPGVAQPPGNRRPAPPYR